MAAKIHAPSSHSRRRCDSNAGLEHPFLQAGGKVQRIEIAVSATHVDHAVGDCWRGNYIAAGVKLPFYPAKFRNSGGVVNASVLQVAAKGGGILTERWQAEEKSGEHTKSFHNRG